MDHLCALQRDFINLRLGTFIHWNSAAVQFHANPDIIDWEFDLENGGEPRRYPFPESDWAPRAPDCDRWAQIAKSAGCRFAVLTAKHHEASRSGRPNLGTTASRRPRSGRTSSRNSCGPSAQPVCRQACTSPCST